MNGSMSYCIHRRNRTYHCSYDRLLVENLSESKTSMMGDSCPLLQCLPHLQTRRKAKVDTATFLPPSPLNLKHRSSIQNR